MTRNRTRFPMVARGRVQDGLVVLDIWCPRNTVLKFSGIVAAIPSGRFDLLFSNVAEVDLRLESIEH